MDWLRGIADRTDLVFAAPASSSDIAAAESVLGPLPPLLRQFYAVANGLAFGVRDGAPDTWTLCLFSLSELAAHTPTYREGFELPDLFAIGLTGTGEGFLYVDEFGQVGEALLYSRQTLSADLETFLRRILNENLWWI